MKQVVRIILAAAAVAALAVPAMAADKLIVKDAAGTANVFTVADNGVTTIANAAGVEATSMLIFKDTVGLDSLNFRGDGFLQVSGSGTSQATFLNYIGTAGVSTSSPNARPLFEMYRLRGSKSSFAPVMQNDKLGTISFAGYDGSGTVSGGKISAALLEVYVDGPVATGSVPQRMSIITGTSFANRFERLVVKADGKVGIGTNAPTSIFQVVGLPTYADNAAATAGGLTAGAFYKTATGVVMVRY